MGLIEFIILCVVTLVIAWGGVLVLGLVAPGHPAIIDRLIWGVAVIIIVFALVRATGIMSHDPQIPHV